MSASHTLAAGYVLAGLTAGALLIPSQVAVACPAEPRLTVAVVTEHHPLVVRSSYSVEIRDAEAGQTGCKQAVHVQVSMILGGRVIEVGTDIPCRRDAVLSHYQRHAEQDDTLLSRYAGQALATFDRMSSAELLGTRTRGDAKEAVTGVVRSTLDGLLQSYGEERFLAAADSDAELLRLGAACGRDT